MRERVAAAGCARKYANVCTWGTPRDVKHDIVLKSIEMVQAVCAGARLSFTHQSSDITMMRDP